MSSQERLNVLLSRARKGLVLIGDTETFLASRKGAQVWEPLIRMLAARNLIFEGLPVRCEQHPSTEMLLKKPEDFDKHCPDGGCSTQWYVSSASCALRAVVRELFSCSSRMTWKQ